MAVFVSVLAVAVAMGCFIAILLSDIKNEEKDNDTNSTGSDGS